MTPVDALWPHTHVSTTTLPTHHPTLSPTPHTQTPLVSSNLLPPCSFSPAGPSHSWSVVSTIGVTEECVLIPQCFPGLAAHYLWCRGASQLTKCVNEGVLDSGRCHSHFHPG